MHRKGRPMPNLCLMEENLRQLLCVWSTDAMLCGASEWGC